MNQGVARRVVTKVRLVHQLLVEARSHGHVVTCRAGRASLLPLEELGQDKLLLIGHTVDIDAFALDRSAAQYNK